MATDTGQPAQALADLYGGFVVGDMRLALPACSLVEVALAPMVLSLPCEQPAVIGGLPFRGAVVPVVELHLALGLEGAPPQRPCVLLVRDAGRLIGLAVDRPLGLFAPAPGTTLQRISHSEGHGAAWLAGSLAVPGEDAPLLLLSLASFLAEPGLPSAVEQEALQAPAEAGSEPDLALLVVDSQGVQLAIDAMAVQGTLPCPDLQHSPLARGHCRGVLEVQGGCMPVADLLAWVGLGRTQPGPGSKVLRIAVGGRLIGLLVDHVLEIIHVAGADLAPAPSCALSRAGLFAGVLARPGPQAATNGPQTCYVLDASALAADQELLALAELSAAQPVGAGAQGLDEAGPPADAGLLNAEMLVYDAGRPAATPLLQVEEILSFMASGNRLAGQAPLLGLVPHRGHGIPVFCLASLLGTPPAELGSQACVLVVPRPDGQRVGLAVPRLSCIERATWHTALRGAARQLGGLAQAARGGELALFGGSGGQPERMVQVMDLCALAGTLGHQGEQSQEVPIA